MNSPASQPVSQTASQPLSRPEQTTILRRYRAGFILAGLLLAYTVAGFQLVPRLVAGILVDTVRKDYGRELALGAVHFNPWSLALRVEQLALPDADGGQLLSFDSLLLDLELSSLWNRAWTFSQVALDGLELHPVIRPGGELNLADLAVPDSPDGAPAADDAPLPRLRIHDLALTAGRIRIEDRDRPEPYEAELAPLEFRLADFSTHATSGDLYELDATLFGQSPLRWRGTLRARPLASQGEFSVADLPLPRIAAWLGDALPVGLQTGTAGIQGRYRFALAGDDADLLVEQGKLTVGELALRIPGEEADAIALAELAATGLRLATAERQLEIADLTITGARVEGWLTPDGGFNLLALTGAGAGGPEVGDPELEPGSAASPEWTISLPRISVRESAVRLEDRSVQPSAALVFEPLSITAEGFSTAPGTQVALGLDAKLNGEASLALTGVTELDSGNARIDFQLQDLDLRPVQPYLARETSLTLMAGALSSRGELTWDGASSALAFDGEATVANLRTVDNALGQDFVKWSALRLTGLRYRSSPESLRIAGVDATDPYVRLIIGPDGTTNINAILAGPGATAAAPAGPTLEAEGEPGRAGASVLAPGAGTARDSADPAPASGPADFPIQVGTVRIRGGSGNFADFTTRPNFAIAIEALAGTITGLSSAPDSRARVDLAGQVDRFSPVTISGDVNPLAAETFVDMAMTVENVELTSFTPYAGRFAGYSIRQGKLSADLNYKVNDRQLDADHRFVLNQLELGDKVESPDALGLPLKLAIALLKDRNGVIDLDLPVTGNLDDPEFRVGPIVWKVLVNLLTKAVTAPFALLGSLFGGGEEINLIEFPAGSDQLNEADREKLATLVRALNDRPGLKLRVPAAYSGDADSPVLTERNLQRAVMEAKEAEAQARRKPENIPPFEVLAADRADYLRQLRSAWRQVAGSDLDFPEPVPPPDGSPRLSGDALLEARVALLEEDLRRRLGAGEEQLFELGRERAVAARDLLLADSGIDPGRVFLTSPVSAAVTAAGVRMELALE